MRYSIEPKDRIYEGHGFLSFAKNMDTHAIKVAKNKNLSNKYSQKLLDTAKKIYNRCNKNCSQESSSKNQKQLVI